MKVILLLGFFISTLMVIAQPGTKTYRTTPDKINDLVHTKLEAKFDYQNQQLNGKTWITLKPHFYTTDSLTLDAKGMDIKEVAVVKAGKNNKLEYDYDGLFLKIKLDKAYVIQKAILFILIIPPSQMSLRLREAPLLQMLKVYIL